jgi:ribosomal protein L44E
MRLGDDIDDYCSRCKLSTTHAVVSMAGEELQKVRCRTCNHEHNYRRNKGGRGPMSKKEAFDRVMASVTGVTGESRKSSKN